MEILPLFCEIDDFCKVFEKIYQCRALSNRRRRKRATRPGQSKVMTILVLYHASGYKNLKAFYLEEIVRRRQSEFPALCGYQWNFLGNLAAGLIAYIGKEKETVVEFEFRPNGSFDCL